MTLGPAILTLDAALDGCGAGVVVSGRVVAGLAHAGGRGSAAILPTMARQVLQASGIAAGQLAAVAVTVGPGSFTGVRAALALAHGIGLAAGVPILGVNVGDAVRAGMSSTRPVWVAVDSKRGRVFLDDGEAIVAASLDALPPPAGPATVAGNAAQAVAARWLASGFVAEAAPFDGLSPYAIAAAARALPRAAQPLYVDPPQARPGVGTRPAPSG